MKSSSKHAPPVRPHSKNQDKSRLLTVAASLTVGVGAGGVGFFLLLLIFSAFCLLLKDPHSLALSLSLGAIYLSAFIAGFASVRRNGRRDALLLGSLSGLLLLLLLSALLLLVGNSEADGEIKHALLLRLLVIPIAIGGAFLGATRRKPKRKKRF